MTIELGAGRGPLRGVRVVEIAGLGPGPHAAMTLADLGADVVRIDRPGGAAMGLGEHDLLTRGRPSVALDLKQPAAVDAVLRLVGSADLLVEGMRPGVAERLGLGPEACHAVNPALVYGRMTGWGQDGPWAPTAGHDLGYVALTGVLDGLGQDPARPHFPENLLGDFGGGSTYLVIGLLAALTHARATGEGQVVDAAIVDGTTHLATMSWAMRRAGLAAGPRGTNYLDGGAPYYDLHRTSDDRQLAVGALEPAFFAELVGRLGIADRAPAQHDVARHDELRSLIAEAVASRTLAQWCEVFEGSDACVAPVLTFDEAREHPHLAARAVWVEHEGRMQPAPAPRFDRTPAALGLPPSTPGGHTREALTAWGLDDVDDLLASGAAVQA